MTPQPAILVEPGYWWPVLASPHDSAMPPAQDPHSPEPTTSASRLILVIDDDLSIRAMVAELLEFEGYQVATAANGAEGLLLVSLLRPALVLLDMRMPVLDGWRFAQELSHLAPRLPIIVMSAAQDVEGWANEIGAAASVAKPFNIQDLLEAVEQTLL